MFFYGRSHRRVIAGRRSPQLRELGRSITEPGVQQAYRDYVLAFVEKFEPEYIGLAAETNLIRLAAETAVYAAVVQAANSAAAELQSLNVTQPLLISVQVETACGVLGGTGPYAGIETDFIDFPFMQILGLSSYPYFSYAQPEDLPADYYGRLLNGRQMPVLVSEGGWSSACVNGIASSPEAQARYILRHADLLDDIEAVAVVQTLFADIDMNSLPDLVPPNLPLFATIGLMDENFLAKPALSVWDDHFTRQKI